MQLILWQWLVLSRQPLPKPGQDGGGRGDVCAGAARIREGVGSGAHIDTQSVQQSRQNQGKMAEAEEMYVWALRGYEKALDGEMELRLLISSHVMLVSLRNHVHVLMYSFGDYVIQTDDVNMLSYSHALMSDCVGTM